MSGFTKINEGTCFFEVFEDCIADIEIAIFEALAK